MISAATEKLTRLVSTEKVLRGQKINEATFERAGESALTEAEVIGDSRGSAAYKSELVRVYVRRALRQAGLGVTSHDNSQTDARGTGGSLASSAEAREKVTGRADYVHNMRLPGMLIAKVARSTVAHGRIVSIDTSAALQVEGVFAVYTGEDIRKIIPEPYYGPAFHDQPILALGKVRHVGEPVAVALAR